MNAVSTRGDRFGTSLLYGHGAGGDATASAVVSNISYFGIKNRVNASIQVSSLISIGFDIENRTKHVHK